MLAHAGIKFTVLSPYQANKVRPAGGRGWKDVSGGKSILPWLTGFACNQGFSILTVTWSGYRPS